MARSFSLVDHKVAEADFFLEHILKADLDFFAVRCYVSAFVAAARSITFALQSVLSNAGGFKEWYEEKQKGLKNDQLARFFQDFRTISQHIGDNLVSLGSYERDDKGNRITKHYFLPTPDIQTAPKMDVYSACHDYLTSLITVVYECYLKFGPLINAHQRYTAEYFNSIGLTIEDAEEELFGIRGWTGAPGIPDEYRWQMISDSQTGCEINHLFQKYIGKTIPIPEHLPSPANEKKDGFISL